uniref:PD-(D/E)XK nuclease superfamily protein n=1 Tax=Eubacterium cellulosolvens (strain ATCC 43171 / JCM 9499 / 6) TaxID=633697 RepID=I5AXL8_EUBC6
MERFEQLVSKCKTIVRDHYAIAQDEIKKYNIYRILHLTQNEVQMCRVLADLLNPSGEHGQGAKYLGHFARIVLGLDISDEEMKDAHVYKEYPITDDRRIDIVIAYHGGFIPMEVKINARDQKSQCYDYYHFAKERDKNAFIVYLTKSGYKPSEKSVTGGAGDRLPEEAVKCISFSEDILRWLEEIKSGSSDEMRVLIDQYAGAVKEFVNVDDMEYKMNLTNKILTDTDSFRTSLEIAGTVNHAKAEIMKKLFYEFETQMQPILGKYNLELETKSEWFHYKYQATEEYYARNESTYPGLNYVIKSVNLGIDLSLWLRIEVDYKLFGSLCVFDYGAESNTGNEVGNQCDDISDELWSKLREHVNLPEKKEKKGWIIAWKYLPTGSDSTVDAIETVPDFKKMNEAAIALVDETARNAFVAKCITAMEETLLSLIK